VNFIDILPRVPRRVPSILLAGLLTLLAAASARAEKVYLEVDAPRSGDLVREPLGLMEVRGWAGTGLRGKHDVIIVLDRSASTFRASGVDVDADGRVGRNFPGEQKEHPVLWTSDFGDTVISAELLAARRLIERLDPESTRMGLVSFGSNAKLEAPLGSSRAQLLAALDAIPPEPKGGTYFYGALEEAIVAFGKRVQDPADRRQRQILLLSDGIPTAPDPPAAALATSVRAARNAARAGARISAFALGPSAAQGRALFEEIVAANGGDLVVLSAPADIVEFVPYMSWTSIAKIELENATTREPGRAVRLFPDGSFDGFAPLVPGRNELRLKAQSTGGATQSVTRWVTFEKTLPDPEKLERLRKTLEIRAVETQLAERARVKREKTLELQKRLEIEAVPDR
jgi:uncharacterized protein YegL